MRTTMASRERILATCAHEATDRVPLHLDVHPSYQQYDPRVATWRDQFERTDALLSLGADAMVEVWLPDPSFHPDVQVRSWREEGAGPAGEALLYKEYATPAGSLRQVIRETDDLYHWHKINRATRCLPDLIDGVGLLEDVNPSRSVEFLVKCPQDLAAMRYLFRPLSGDALRRWREDALYAKQQAQARRTVFLARRTYGGSALVWLTDVTESMLTFESDPAFVADFLQIIQDWQKATLEPVLELGVDMVTRFGYYDIPDFWGVRYFDRYLRPLMDEEADLVHQAGALLSQQQSKGLTPLAPTLKQMRVDVFRDVDPVQGGEDMALLKRELGPTKTLMGGMNCDVFLAGASPEEIDRTVAETLELMAPGGGFILHPVTGIYAGVPWSQVMLLVESWKRHC